MHLISFKILKNSGKKRDFSVKNVKSQSDGSQARGRRACPEEIDRTEEEEEQNSNEGGKEEQVDEEEGIIV